MCDKAHTDGVMKGTGGSLGVIPNAPLPFPKKPVPTTETHPFNEHHPNPHSDPSTWTRGGSITTGGGFPENMKDAYHYILNMRPHHLESYREIASQLLGGVPSHMWGNLVEDEDKELKTSPQHYENIIRMPDTNHLARMVEADHGGGFWDAVSHVGKIAAKAYSHGRVAAQYLNKFRDPLLTAFGLEKYSPYINSFADRLSNIDNVVNPLVEMTLKHINNPNIQKETIDRIKNETSDYLKNKAHEMTNDVFRR